MCQGTQNSVQNGFGSVIASLPKTLAIDPDKTSQVLDPNNPDDDDVVKTVRYSKEIGLLLPSTIPATVAKVYIILKDAANQAVHGKGMALK